MKKFFKDFKTFISKGNVMQLAIGVVIGAAFGAITTSLVTDIITPLISTLTKGTPVSEWRIILSKAVYDTDGVTVLTSENAILYGKFLQTIFNFIIIALSIFVFLRIINYVQNKASKLNNKKRNAYIASLKKQHKSINEIKVLLAEWDKAQVPATTPPEPTKEVVLLTDIKDLLTKIAEK